MIIPALLIALLIYYIIARMYVDIGKNVGHESPWLGYLIFVPFVVQIYVAQLAKAKGLAFWGIILLNLAIIGVTVAGLEPVAQILNWANMFYMSYFLIIATQMSMMHLLWNIIPGLGFLIVFCLAWSASKKVTPSGGNDLNSAFESMSEQEQQLCEQIFNALQSGNAVDEASVIAQLRSAGINGKRAQVIYKTAVQANAQSAQA